MRADRQKGDLGLRLCDAVHRRQGQPRDEDLAFWKGTKGTRLGLNGRYPVKALRVLMALKNVLAFVAARDLEEGIRWYKMGVENVQKLKLNTAMLRPLSSVATKPANVASASLRRATCLVGRISRTLFCVNCF